MLYTKTHDATPANPMAKSQDSTRVPEQGSMRAGCLTRQPASLRVKTRLKAGFNMGSTDSDSPY